MNPNSDKISIIIPTRKRPNNIERLFNSLINTADEPNNLEICLYLDDDDVDTINYISNKYINDNRVLYFVGPRIVLSQMWNEAYKLATGNIIMHGGDDLIFRSKSWDSIVRKAFNNFPDKILLVYGRDGIKDKELATHSFIHRRWIEVSGFFLPPYFTSDYNDTWLDNVSQKVGRRCYLPEVFTEHMHYSVGKAVKDENTIERYVRANKQNPKNLYLSLEHERLEHAYKLNKYIKNFSQS